MQVLIDKGGNLLEILQEGQAAELQEGQSIVPLMDYYEIRNEQRYDNAVWDFEQKKWVGVGEQRPIVIPQPSDMESLKEENEILKSKLQTTEHMARETSQAQQELLELLIEMGVI